MATRPCGCKLLVDGDEKAASICRDHQAEVMDAALGDEPVSVADGLLVVGGGEMSA